jgi:hypothetical protein
MPMKIREKAKSEKSRRWTRNKFAEQLVATRNAMPLHFIVKGEKAPAAVIVRKDDEGNVISETPQY